MSDLLAPLLAVMENEVDSFWCFVGFMETVVSVHCNGSLAVKYFCVSVLETYRTVCINRYKLW